MNKSAVLHIPKSQYSFAYGEAQLRIRLRTARDDIDGVEIIYAVKYNWLTERNTAQMEKIFSDSLYDYYAVTLDVPDSRIGYIFYIKSGNETYYYSEEGLTKDYNHEKSYYNFFQFPYINTVDLHKKVSWCDGAVFYQIFVERFFEGDQGKDRSYINMEWGAKPTPKSFAGGDLKGIIQKLDYLEGLGINGVYLTPVFCSPSNHKYDITDYDNVDKMFGTNNDLKVLVDECHKRGIKILLDAVFNHGSCNGAQFADVLKNGRQSKYYNWFIIHGDKPDMQKMNYECFAACNYMPKWNTNNQDVQRFLIRIAVKWIKEYGIDGWRLDVADEVSHDFWRNFRKAVKAANPEALIIGESWHDANPWLKGDQFDSIMNYSFTKACLDYFAYGKHTTKSFCDRLSEVVMRNTDQVNEMMLNLLDSHDTERFITNAGGDVKKLKCALAVMFFFTGMPCIYYGTEIGLPGGYDPDSRRCFNWDKSAWNMDIYDTVKHLILLKKQKINGTMKLYTQDEIFVCEREKLLLAVNNTDNTLDCVFCGKKSVIEPYSYKIFDKEDNYEEV